LQLSRRHFHPIYNADDIREMVKHTVTLDYEEVSDITPDVRLTFYNSGHILGSSMAHLHIGNGLHNLLYTGDMKFGKTQLFAPAATIFPRLETLMIESTYGGKENVLPPLKDEEEDFRQVIIETIKKGGKVLMPVLGSGRAQDMIIILEEMIRTGQIEKIPVYIDGMVWDIMAIHTTYPEFLNSAMRNRIFHKDENPFLSDIFKRVGSKKERQQIIESGGSCVILATSGMLVGGPSVEYLKKWGIFDVVEVNHQTTPEGAVLDYHLEEATIVAAIDIAGNYPYELFRSWFQHL
jgi:predicted metal-dependent RNase